ncbi:cytochrome P450 [Ophiobolus disseminans]|uniref:Cytochrome P450 n=1 Tax=Ophiobolus disseminans TaxID=1469910 RepID=A0A6A6ZGZ3_9PLEO|nr:cytochrome P450 [Ophiobolus disseminans]
MAVPFSVNLTFLFFILVVYLVGRFYRSRKNVLQLPPGPKGLPLLGNINDLPKDKVPEWQHWLAHKDKYGPISSLTVLGNTFVVLNSADAALELLKDRAAIHSGRPILQFGGAMLGWDNTIGLQQPSAIFKQHRRNIAKIASSAASTRVFDRIQEEEAAHFLLNLLESPDELFDHIRREAAAVVARVIYGYIPKAHGTDPLIELVTKVMEEFGDAGVPGKWMVDVLPFLRYLPDWCPGAGFKATARAMKRHVDLMIELPLAFVKKQMREKKHRVSYLSQAIEGSGLGDETENIVHKNTAVSLYAGGADTTVASLMSFFLAMTLFPEVQKTAQEELDRVIGSDRLPTNADKDRLPYIDAIVKETHRWQLIYPIAPMGLPHMSNSEDFINGYRIPKGTLLMANTWWFTHDPAVYPDPMVFKPERYFTNPPATDPRIYTFGYGRRSCPGRHVADAALFVTIAQALSVFRISKATQNGVPIEPVVEFEAGVVSHPKPYTFAIAPRSEKHAELIRRSEEVYPREESDAGFLEDVGREKGLWMGEGGW